MLSQRIFSTPEKEIDLDNEGGRVPIVIGSVNNTFYFTVKKLRRSSKQNPE
jgi:hypothetical protein